MHPLCDVGATAFDGDAEPVFVPAPTVEVVEPVGAGDAFAAGFLAATLEGVVNTARRRHLTVEVASWQDASASRAVGDTEVAVLGRREFEAILQAFPAARMKVAHAVQQRMERLGLNEALRRSELFGELDSKFAQDLARDGRTAILWADMFLPKTLKNETGNAYTAACPSKEKAAYMLSRLDKSVILADWQYDARK